MFRCVPFLCVKALRDDSSGINRSYMVRHIRDAPNSGPDWAAHCTSPGTIIQSKSTGMFVVRTFR